VIAQAAGERAISFGPSRLLRTQRLVLEGEKPVRLGSRALGRRRGTLASFPGRASSLYTARRPGARAGIRRVRQLWADDWAI
jgi:hypothetical protein